MTDREKLIEQMKVPIHPLVGADPAEVVADYLLDNGVTFAADTNAGSKWIPVTIDTAPERFTKVLAYFPNKDYGSKSMVSYNECEKGKPPYFAESHLWGLPSHWIPLPEPPKGV